MNYLWAVMILVGVVYAAISGTLPEVTTAVVESSKEAVTLCITMLGIMSFWMGLMKIAESAGIISGAVKKLNPVLKIMFPNLPKNHIARKYIAVNMIANIFGLGWAATPAGLKAMEALQEINVAECEKKGVTKFRGTDIATKEMCDFLIINMSSLQLIPINIIAYRSQYGSVNPAEIVGPAIVATSFSTLTAVVFCKMMGRKRN